MATHWPYRFLSRVLIGGIIAAALITLFGVRDSPVHAVGTFDSTTTYFFCNQLDNFTGPTELQGDPLCTSDYSANTAADWGFTFDVPIGDYNFSSFAVFVSEDFTIANDAAITDGTVIGGITVSSTLGLLGNSCQGGINPQFIMYDATTDTANTVNALPEGTSDRFSNLVDDDDAFAGQADADSPGVLQYPSFLNTLLDPDLDYPGGPNGPVLPISPHARYTGLTKVAGLEWVFLSILVFEKSQLTPFGAHANNATHPLARYGANPTTAGWVLLLVLQDPTETLGRIQSITDFCSPVTADAMFLGRVDSDGDTVKDTDRQTNPAAGTGIDGVGTHLLMLYGMSQRDFDEDGLENNFDTCPFDANVDDPRVTTGADGDMLDPACDPDPGTNENFSDFDNDGYLNSQDNCPKVGNSLGVLHPSAPFPNPGPDNQAEGEQTNTYILAAPDAGFRTDSIGDACDSEGGGSDTVADGIYLHDMNTDAACIGAVDTSPADGFCDAGGESSSTIDTDGDVTAGGGAGGTFTNSEELFMQTDPLVDCPQVVGHDAWPPDFDSNGTVNILDIVQWTPPAFGTSPPDPNYTQRKDLDANGTINILDIVVLTPPTFGTSCTP